MHTWFGDQSIDMGVRNMSTTAQLSQLNDLNKVDGQTRRLYTAMTFRSPTQKMSKNIRPTAHELLNAYGCTYTIVGLFSIALVPGSPWGFLVGTHAPTYAGMMRGYMTFRDLPDCSRSSRYVLKDYVNAKMSAHSKGVCGFIT